MKKSPVLTLKVGLFCLTEIFHELLSPYRRVPPVVFWISDLETGNPREGRESEGQLRILE
jgi:hypothetical protein